MTELRLCMVVHQNYYRDGRVRRYAEALVKTGAKVDVLCVRDAEKDRPAEEEDGLRVFTIPIGRGYKGPGSYLVEYTVSLVFYTIWMLGLYIRNGYHVIHVHNMPDFLVLSALIPRIFGAKIILDVHDPMPEFYMSKYQAGEGNRLVSLMKFQERLSARLAQGVVTANYRFAENLASRGTLEDKIRVVRNLPDTQIFNREKLSGAGQKDNEHFTLVYPGTIAPRYGLTVAIKALPLLVEQVPEIRLLVVGHFVDHVNELRSLAEELDVSDYVEFKPVVPIQEVPLLMARADAGVYLGLSDPHMETAIPTKVLEYAFMGIPIITSRLMTVEDLFPESAVLYFEPGNHGQFASRVLELYNNPDLRISLVENADQFFVSQHKWENELAVYFELLNELVGAKVGRLAIQAEHR